jgi:hypothetical protein
MAPIRTCIESAAITLSQSSFDESHLIAQLPPKPEPRICSPIAAGPSGAGCRYISGDCEYGAAAVAAEERQLSGGSGWQPAHAIGPTDVKHQALGRQPQGIGGVGGGIPAHISAGYAASYLTGELFETLMVAQGLLHELGRVFYPELLHNFRTMEFHGSGGYPECASGLFA